MWITTNDKGLIYQDDGSGLRGEAGFEALIKLGESGWDQRIEEEQEPTGVGIHCLLAHKDVESITFSSNGLSLELDPRRWWVDEAYLIHWKENLRQTCFPLPGLTVNITCSPVLTESLVKVLTISGPSPAQGYYDLLKIWLNGEAVKTEVPAAALPTDRLIETEYQNNRLVIGLYDQHGLSTTSGLWINWYGQMIGFPLKSHFNAYLEVRRGRPVNPMSPSRRGLIQDQALQDLLDFIREALADYFAKGDPVWANALALRGFYRDYPQQAQALPVFVAVRRNPYQPGENVTEMTKLLTPEVFTYQRPPLLLAGDVKLVDEDGEVRSESYGLHTFLELTGASYKVIAANNSRLNVRHLWWKPSAQISLPSGCPTIFKEAGQWGLGTHDKPPAEWNDVGDHTVFTFNDASNWNVNDVDFTVGGADPKEFYQLDAWGGFDPNNDEWRSYEEMAESYSQSCDREIRDIIGNAVPEDFRWNDLQSFVPQGLQITAVTPEYTLPHHRTPKTLTLTLNNNEEVMLRVI